MKGSMGTMIVTDLQPATCATTNCSNTGQGGRMVLVTWQRGQFTGLNNELTLCHPCWDSLRDEVLA